MLEKMKQNKGKYGAIGAVILTGLISGVALKLFKEKRRNAKMLQELEDAAFENFDI